MKFFKPIFKHWSYLADFVVIVAGIIVALSLDAWWQNKQERKLEQEYLEQLYVDFKGSKNSMSSSIDVNTNRISNLKSALRIINEQLDFTPEEMSKFLESAWLTEEFKVHSGSYYSLMQSGHLYIINNSELRLKLSDFNGLIDIEQRKLIEVFAQASEVETSPFFIEHLSLNQLIDDQHRAFAGMPETNLFKTDYNDIINDKRFVSFIEQCFAIQVREALFKGKILKYIDEILQLLEWELGIESTD